MAKAKFLTLSSRISRWRVWVQTAFLLVWLNPLLVLHSVCGPVFHCYSCPLSTFACPIGVVAGFSAMHTFPFLAVGTIVLAGALLGAFVCGWLCPFGLLQDLMGRIPTPKFRLPAWTGYSRYVVLGAFVIAVPHLFGEGHFLYICRLCPAGALEGAVPNSVRSALAGQPVIWPSVLKLGILGLFLVAMFFTWRPWCRLFCPLGAVYGVFNRVSLLFLKHRPERCDDCGACERPCRYGILPDKGTRDPSCIRCLECARCGAISVATPFGSSSKPEKEEA